MALTTQRLEDLDATRVTDERPDPYEYRWGDYDDAARWFPHPHDNSLVTFRGHRVRWTLIRCHFSPPGSTDSRYVYSGSFDGGVYVWNLDATLAARIDVRGSTGAAGAGVGRRRRWGNRLRDEVGTLVRDVGWHPSAPLLVGGLSLSSFFLLVWSNWWVVQLRRGTRPRRECLVARRRCMGTTKATLTRRSRRWEGRWTRSWRRC